MSLDQKEILAIFRETGALLEGHFILTSGLHSQVYFQCAKVFQYPLYSEKICQETAAHFKNQPIDLVVSPAVGGIIFGYELARQLGVRSVFTERIEGKMSLRRGFEIKPGEKVLVAEDVTTTGSSVREVVETVRDKGGEVLAVTAVVDRSGGKVDFGVPYYSLVQMEIRNYKQKDCPSCKEGSRAEKPGSRGNK
ncbi:MAG: orotate phosphoribosyltransferase [Acidobacteriota bacterium]